MKIAWLHDDALRHWFGSAPAVYVFDEEKLKREQWSLKRIGFIYECLLELPVEIRRGDVVSEVREFQRMHAAEGVVTMQTPDPRLREQSELLQAEVCKADEFVSLTGRLNLERFSRYWSKAERALLAAANLER